jgi:hypothetical protein
VVWPDARAGGLYTCGGVDIHVKSVRWSYTRYSSPDATLGSSGARTALPTTQDCIARGTCREVDATVWVVPRCAEGGLGCVPEAPCFPFCMAARAAGSGRDNLFLARAGRWRDGLMLMAQDCALATTTPGLVGSSMGDVGPMSWATAGSQQGGSKGMFGSTYQPQECQRAARVTTVVDQPPARAGSAARIRVSGQPFVITGDTALVEVGGDTSLGGRTAVEAMAGSVQVWLAFPLIFGQVLTHVIIRSSGWPGTRPGRSACVGWRRRCRRWTGCWCRRTRRRGRTRAR